MDWLNKVLASLAVVVQGAGSVVDAAVPVAQGDRTKIGALVAVGAPFLCAALNPLVPAACPIIQTIGVVATTLTPLFAFAGVVRKK